MASASDSKRALIPECFAQTGLSAAEVCFPDTQGWAALLASQIQRAFEAFLQLSNSSSWGRLLSRRAACFTLRSCNESSWNVAGMTVCQMTLMNLL